MTVAVWSPESRLQVCEGQLDQSISRRQAKALRKANRGQRCLIPGFTLKWTDLRLLLRPIAQWVWIELTEGWRSWWQPPKEKTLVGAAANTTPA
jgi:hypothetical protein